MQRIVEDAKSIIERMFANLSIYAGTDERVRDPLDRTFKENHRLRTQIIELQEAQRRRGKEHIKVNLIETPCESYGGQDHYTSECTKTALVGDSKKWVEQLENVSYVSNQGNNNKLPYQRPPQE